MLRGDSVILGEPWPCGTPHSASFAARAFALGGYKGRDRRGDNKRTTAREAAPRGRGADQDGRQETRDERQETERVIMTRCDNCVKMSKFETVCATTVITEVRLFCKMQMPTAACDFCRAEDVNFVSSAKYVLPLSL